MIGLHPLDSGAYPGVAPGDDGVRRAKCYSRDCQMLAAGEGSAAWLCKHEHMVTEAQFCRACWIDRIYARWTWYCENCQGTRPDGSHEEWGHLCPMTLVLPSERMSA